MNTTMDKDLYTTIVLEYYNNILRVKFGDKLLDAWRRLYEYGNEYRLTYGHGMDNSWIITNRYFKFISNHNDIVNAMNFNLDRIKNRDANSILLCTKSDGIEYSVDVLNLSNELLALGYDRNEKIDISKPLGDVVKVWGCITNDNVFKVSTSEEYIDSYIKADKFEDFYNEFVNRRH